MTNEQLSMPPVILASFKFKAEMEVQEMCFYSMWKYISHDFNEQKRKEIE